MKQPTFAAKIALNPSGHRYMGMSSGVWFFWVLWVGGQCNHAFYTGICSTRMGYVSLSTPCLSCSSSQCLAFFPCASGTVLLRGGHCQWEGNKVCLGQYQPISGKDQPKDSQRTRSLLLFGSFVSGINVVTDLLTRPHRLTTAIKGINHRTNIHLFAAP